MAADVRRPRTVREAAPAKVNLFLHLVGRRPDGYHLLDGLVAFTAFGDRVEVTPADDLSIAVDGPFAAQVPADGSNLALKAAVALRDLGPSGEGAHIRLEKRVPVAAGLGGGSGDAAAVLRALTRLWRWPRDHDLHDLAASLGADVPMCLAGMPARIAGIGDRLSPCASFPSLPILLVNPGVPLGTPEVFRARKGDWRPALPAFATDDADGLLAALADTRNDLTDSARVLAPSVGTVLERLTAAPGCRLARMSGSGATCFGLFPDAGDATRAARRLRREQPGWWVAATRLR
ncbi:4-diphosphocytidyl-2-C-methyl-D-erythritol kinase [Stella humosa]|uniref:4-diphosphocytidyl-2-C-methyl-D-erythritol kinase n=1 Tax=Stella humosa TaxID=94 RepID=A0A3N1KZC3_9PROT|nr:4-(cytidine 5'-diphospho)-2-C-methyl-D-erythritol kinase [Stella humosa]ROP84139.1 4-diphosphocytidyl-2-C-methyl-D-erythritol kinase [Stella humosa]BBK33649.1 4-diphosphocytidyl-2-C-methyl-D-erythritol kinase [Stella humosa]